MDINYLAKLVYMMSHKKVHKPDALAIKKEYLTAFFKDGKLEEADLGPEGFDEDRTKRSRTSSTAAVPA